MNKIIIIIISLAILTGCTGFIHTKKAAHDEINKGISYYLPKRQHKLTVTAEYLEVKKASKDYEKKLAEYKLDETEANNLKSKWMQLESVAKQTPEGKAKEEAVKAAQTAEGIYKAANIIAKSAEEAMKEAKRKLDYARKNESSPGECHYYTKMKVSALPLEPDTRYSFLLELEHSPLRDDKMNIETTSNGLITSDTNITTTDRTGDIAVEIAKMIAMFGFSLPAPPPSTDIATFKMAKPDLERTVKPLECYTDLLMFEAVTDFEDEITVDLHDHGYKPDASKFVIPTLYVDIQNRREDGVSIKEIVDNKIAGQSECKSPNWDEKCRKNNGILYRRDETYTIRLLKETKETKETKKIPVAFNQVTIPNLSPISLIPAESLFLVTTTNNATFKDGMLIKYDTNQPSQALEVVRLPARVLQGMLEAVTTFLQLKVNYTKEQKNLIDELNNLRNTLEGQGSVLTGPAGEDGNTGAE